MFRTRLYTNVLFTFQSKYNISEEAEKAKNVLISENRYIREHIASSWIKLQVNVASHLVYRCEFAIVGMGYCRDSKLLDFRGMYVSNHVLKL